MDETLSRNLPLIALNRAINLRSPSEELIHHSNRGSQYASKDYVERLNECHIQISMSRNGICYAMHV